MIQCQTTQPKPQVMSGNDLVYLVPYVAKNCCDRDDSTSFSTVQFNDLTGHWLRIDLLQDAEVQGLTFSLYVWTHSKYNIWSWPVNKPTNKQTKYKAKF